MRQTEKKETTTADAVATARAEIKQLYRNNVKLVKQRQKSHVGVMMEFLCAYPDQGEMELATRLAFDAMCSPAAEQYTPAFKAGINEYLARLRRFFESGRAVIELWRFEEETKGKLAKMIREEKPSHALSAII